MNYNDALENNDMTVYDETAQRIEAVYRAFRQVYEVQFPPPKEPTYPIMPNADEKPVLGSFWGVKQSGMVLGLNGSIIVSASHTIPVFLGIKNISELNIFSFEFVVGLAIFVMIEVSLVVFAYSATESEGNTDTAHRVKSFTRGGMWFIVAIAILANVYYVLAANINIPSDGFFAITWEIIRVTIFLLIGTSAPVIAFMTGDILAIDVLKHRAKNKRDMQAWEEKVKADMEAWDSKCKELRAEYTQALTEWRAAMHSAWNSQKSRWGGAVNIQVSKPEQKALETVSNSSKQLDYSQSLNQKAAMQYIMDKADEYKTIAKTVLNSNPKANQRDIAEAIAEAMTGNNRGYMTVIRAYKKLGIEML